MLGADSGRDSIQKIVSASVALPALQWCAVQTRSRHERKIRDYLVARGFEAYLPLMPEIHRWSDREKKVEVPVFAGYVFVRVWPDPAARINVLQGPGVVRIVSFGKTITWIPDKQIEDIKLVLDRKIPCMPYTYLTAGRRVRIRGGCLDGVEGVLVTLNSDCSIVVSIDAIQRSVAIRVHNYDIEPV